MSGFIHILLFCHVILTVRNFRKSMFTLLFRKIKKIILFFIRYDKFKKNGNFYSVHYRPVYSDKVDYFIDLSYKKKCAIILQGPIVYKDNFTFETIKLYKKLYPDCLIILSTWESEKELWNKYDCDIEVLFNKRPNNPGHGSLNLQRESSMNALLKVFDQGYEYVLKTRTDQRLYGENNLSYLICMLNSYPIKKSVSAKGRIISISNGCFKGRLYNVSDMVIFGFTSDVLNYFSYPIDKRCDPEIVQGADLEEYSKKRPGEIYISTSYLERIGHILKWTEQDSLKCFRDYFLIVDSESLDWYWPKYSNFEYRWRNYSNKGLKQLSFKDWILLQHEDL